MRRAEAKAEMQARYERLNTAWINAEAGTGAEERLGQLRLTAVRWLWQFEATKPKVPAKRARKAVQS